MYQAFTWCVLIQHIQYMILIRTVNTPKSLMQITLTQSFKRLKPYFAAL